MEQKAQKLAYVKYRQVKIWDFSSLIPKEFNTLTPEFKF